VKIPFGDEFVKAGQPCSTTRCAVALAINDALGPEYWASVMQEFIVIYRRGQTIHERRSEGARVPTPPHVARFIDGIDRQTESENQPFVPTWPEGVRRFARFTLPIDLEMLKGVGDEAS
jgi:hypothetical protein